MEIPTALRKHSTQFPLIVENSISAALVLSLLARSRASPLVTWAGSRSWGSGPLGESQEKAEQEFLGRPAGCGPSGSWVLTPCHSDSPAAHRQGRLRAPFQGSVWKGKLLLLQDWIVTEATPLGSLIKPPRLVGTAFSSKIAGLVYMCFILSYSNLFTRDRNPGKSILKACWHLSTWQVIKAPWKSQEKTCKPLTKLYDVNAKRRRSAG